MTFQREDIAWASNSPAAHGLRCQTKRILAVLSLLFWTGFIAQSGFQVGKHFTTDSTTIQLPVVTTTFKYNKTFAEGSHESDVSWAELFPSHGTFFSHPIYAVEVSTLSVYHQLHCINGIRQGYWFVYAAAIAGRQITSDQLPTMSSLPHIRHCLDLIRQTLMCHADTTLEVKDTRVNGVHGFGVQREYRGFFNIANSCGLTARVRVDSINSFQLMHECKVFVPLTTGCWLLLQLNVTRDEVSG
ncbi:hypothetical protein HYFRA_00001781 [Hymenoscyphus fraxineus]|uniref:Uncharacterized protein n=1 Tax=Hymenoscyphus fraxineus TaxID=746836 RepID=A0A9N9KKQ0_9HELO|nr:hypothetical protein HYFRA_00001781 [Hymenoscyphus fraxineus]